MRILAIQCNSDVEMDVETVQMCIDNVCKELDVFFLWIKNSNFSCVKR